MGWDSATFWDKGTMGQAQNLAKGWDGPGQPVKIRYGMGDRRVRYFYSCPVPRDKTEQSRKGNSKTGKGRSKTGCSKTGFLLLPLSGDKG